MWGREAEFHILFQRASQKTVNTFISFWHVNYCVLSSAQVIIIAYFDLVFPRPTYDRDIQKYSVGFEQNTTWAQTGKLFIPFPIVGNNATKPVHTVSLFEEIIIKEESEARKKGPKIFFLVNIIYIFVHLVNTFSFLSVDQIVSRPVCKLWELHYSFQVSLLLTPIISTLKCKQFFCQSPHSAYLFTTHVVFTLHMPHLRQYERLSRDV